MARLIDADALAKELLYDAELCARALDSHEITDHKELARLQFEKDCKQNCVYYISEAPTVDAVTVVRCRDCELWNDWDSAGKESLGNYVCSCAHWSVEDGAVLYTRPTDYCSYGERKGGNE